MTFWKLSIEFFSPSSVCLLRSQETFEGAQLDLSDSPLHTIQWARVILDEVPRAAGAVNSPPLGIVCRPIESRDEPIALHWRLMLCRRRRATRDSMACSILCLVTFGSAYHAPFQFKGLHEKDLDWKSYKWCLSLWCMWPCLTFHVSSFFFDITLYYLFMNKALMATKAHSPDLTLFRWCLTGTPLQNRVGELYSLIRGMLRRMWWDRQWGASCNSNCRKIEASCGFDPMPSTIAKSRPARTTWGVSSGAHE